MIRNPRFYFLLSALFLSGGVASFLLLENRLDNTHVAHRVEQNLSAILADAERSAKPILEGFDTLALPANGPAFFWYRGGRLTTWSTNLFTPELFWIGESGGIKFVSSLRGDFITRSWRKGPNHTLVVVIPLVEKFRISNRYLSSRTNDKIFGERRSITLGTELVGGAPVVLDGRSVFFVSANLDELRHGPWSLALITTSILLFITGTLAWANFNHKRNNFGRALIILTGLLGLLRILMIETGFPAAWTSSPLFDSTGFASSSFNPSIGDLFFNSLFVVVVCLYLFYIFHRLRPVRRSIRFPGSVGFILATVCLWLAFFGFLFPFLYYETVFHNSSVTLDWTQSLVFDQVRVLAFFSVLIGSVSSFLFCHILISLSSKLVKASGLLFTGALIVAGGLFAAYFFSSGWDYRITLYVGAGYFLVLFFTDWFKGLVSVSYLTFLYYVTAILVFAIQGSLSIRRFTEERTNEFQYRFGMNFLVQRDVLGEYLLHDASRRISHDQFIQANLNNPLLGKSSIRQKILRVHLNSYFDRYDVEVHLYSTAGEPLDNLSRTDLATFINEYQREADKTSYEGVYFINQVVGVSAKRYVVIAPVLRQGRAVGYVALSLSLKKIVPQNVFPELLVDNRFSENFRPDQYSYAIFQDTTIISSFGAFNYERDFDKNLLENAEAKRGRIDAGSFHHTFTEGDFGRMAVMTTGEYPLFYVASNFAFWALLGILMITLGLLIRSAVVWRSAFQLNYATRIQLYIFLAFILPLVAVSATTLNWTSTSAEDQLDEEFNERAKKISESVAPVLERYLSRAVPAGLASPERFAQASRQEGDGQLLEQSLVEMARLGGVDASIYSTDGRLLATNQVQIFDNLILSNLINPEALGMIRDGNKLFIIEEQVGRLHYNDSYSMVLSPESGALLGILSIPFFESGHSLEKSRITILSNVMIVFIIIFILFTILSFIATRWLTFPLRMITRSLSSTTLKEENKLLDWQSNDEIGKMVEEYNRMVLNLEKNKIDLARSQKESAWREMAQQVAHEIKNPLTPMKLTLQTLEVHLHNEGYSKEKTAEAIRNLLMQLEILNDIATSFSSFARMPAPNLAKVEVTALAEKAVGLYAHHSSGQVEFESVKDKVFVMGDEQLLTRIFSNLILNGLQSGDQGRKVTVVVSIETAEGNVVLRFRDNGRGIEEFMKEKVFIPHFTTKESGSGLGLAISKQGIEQSGGTIWFESTPGEGTTFFISLPWIDFVP